ncbi:MAG: PTS system mannose/fructose/sorbose family transporter subunit IID [Longimicrobiales bacterium]
MTDRSPQRLPLWVKVQLVMRSFAIQASWNTRTMLGHGFGFVLKPLLWWRYEGEGDRKSALARHVDHFNAHPYLASIGLGAVARLEADHADATLIRHFKTAVRGPLGGIGDRLIWVGWLPAVALAAVFLVLIGASPLVVVVGFLAVYNAGHLALRFWGWSAGYRHGTNVAVAIRGAGLQERAEALSRTAALLLGLLLGLSGARGMAAGLLSWVVAGAVLFLVGNRARRRGWRPTLTATALAIGLLALAGALGAS